MQSLVFPRLAKGLLYSIKSIGIYFQLFSIAKVFFRSVDIIFNDYIFIEIDRGMDMQVQGLGQRQTALINASSINRNLRSNASDQQKGARAERRDRVSISNKGRMASLMEGFQKQRESIMKQKNQLIKKTLDNGGSMDSIEKPLELMNDQLANLEKELAKAVEKELIRATEELIAKTKEKAKEEESAEKTQEELDAEKLSSIVQLSGDIEQAKVVTKVQNQLEGEGRVKKDTVQKEQANLAEKVDRAGDTLSGIEKISIKQNQEYLSAKEAKADKLLDTAQNIGVRANKMLHSVNQKIQETNTEEPAKIKEEPQQDEIQDPDTQPALQE